MSYRTLLFGFGLHTSKVSLSRRAFSNTVRVYSTEAEIDSARRWLKTFDKSAIPQTVGDVSYSRSSGPGGQNVNKYVVDTCLYGVI
jgi:protein subunit release factor B